MTEYTVSSGSSVAGLALGAGDRMVVLSGGAAYTTLVSGGGVAVDSGGVLSATALSAGGVLVLSSGLTRDTVVHSGGRELLSGGVASASGIEGHGQEVVGAGAEAVHATIFVSGLQTVQSGGVARDTHVSSGGMVVESGGLALGGLLDVGVASVLSGGVVSGMEVAQGLLYVQGGVASALLADVSFGGDVLIGGTAYGTVLRSGASELVSAGGVASGTMVSGAGQYVEAGGVAIGTVAIGGGGQTLRDHATAIGTEVRSGSLQALFGGLASGTVVSSGGSLHVMAGMAESATLLSGGTEILYQSGTARGTLVSAGGVQSVQTSAVASGTVVSGGGMQIVSGFVNSAMPRVNAAPEMVGSSITSIGSGARAFIATAFASGTTVLSGGVQVLSSFGAADLTLIAAGGVQSVAGGVAAGTTVSGTELVLSGGTAQGSVVASGGTLTILVATSGLASSATDVTLDPGGTIELANFGYTSGTTGASYDSATDVLTVATGHGDYAIQMAGDYAGETFLTPQQGEDDPVIVTLAGQIPCFREGTRIRAEAGDVPVEALRVGDRVLTGTGVLRAVTWIGARTVDCAAHPDPARVQPVRIAAHALGANRPARALFLSPDHALFLDGVLIPVRCLVNGTTIAAVPQARVRYWHVELATHDVILAENLPVETYLDTGNRTAFAGRLTQLHPEFGRPAEDELAWEARACAPLVVAGPALDAARSRIAAQPPAPTPIGGTAFRP
jgi:autotransporter passenger strand-loop-strand repeat protein